MARERKVCKSTGRAKSVWFSKTMKVTRSDGCHDRARTAELQGLLPSRISEGTTVTAASLGVWDDTQRVCEMTHSVCASLYIVTLRSVWKKPCHALCGCGYWPSVCLSSVYLTPASTWWNPKAFPLHFCILQVMLEPRKAWNKVTSVQNLE